MAYETIIVATLQAACVITLNRPRRRNAISAQLMIELTDALLAAAADGASRSVIITGGTDCYSSGRDLKEAAQGDRQSPNRCKVSGSGRVLTRVKVGYEANIGRRN